MRIAIQGIEGSFHEEAAIKLCGDDISLVPCESFRQVFAVVKTGRAERGLVAIENSLHGSINPVYRLLASENLWVTNEIFLKIEQYLIAATDIEPVDFSLIDKVLSQAPALAQCENWLEDNLPQASLEETHDTAESVRYVAHYADKNYAAIASRRAANLYGGRIIAGPINDDPHNYTRFFLLAKDQVDDPKANRTSMILTTGHKPGALYEALSVFADHRINLSKLDSHPIAGDRRHYAFYIDCDSAVGSVEAKRTLSELKKLGCTVKILGSFPKSELPL